MGHFLKQNFEREFPYGILFGAGIILAAIGSLLFSLPPDNRASNNVNMKVTHCSPGRKRPLASCCMETQDELLLKYQRS